MKTEIILITYNNQGHISEAIDSIINQTYEDWSCIIVDNGSTDETFSIASNQIANDARFRIFRKENEGPSAGRNFGVKFLSTETKYIHFLDGDDRLHSQFLDHLVNYLEENPQVGLVGCQYEIIDESGNLIDHGFRSRFRPGRWGFPKSIPPNEYETPFVCFFASTGQGPFAVFRKEIFERTKGYEQRFWSHEDSDVFCQMSLLADVHYLPERFYLKRTHSNNLTKSSKNSGGEFRNKWDFYASTEPQVNELIEKSLKYYYVYHKPLRDLKVSLKAFREFISSKRIHSLVWSFQCLSAGLGEIFVRKSYRSRLAQRRIVQNPKTQ